METKIPFDIHSSHKSVIECGGYVACKACGLYAFAPGNKTFAAICRAFCPKGTKGRYDRMKRGGHPHRKGGKWPSGELEPKPKAVRNSAE